MRSPLTELLGGPLAAAEPWPLNLDVRLCDLRPRFLAKGRAGRGYRAIARNGRVLLASPAPLEELAGKAVCVRLQTWHRAILPGEVPAPYGLLVCVRDRGDTPEELLFATSLERSPQAEFDLSLEVGGGLALVFRRP